MNRSILLCDPSGHFTCHQGSVKSPVLCLDQAMLRTFDLVVISFCGVDLPVHRQLVNLAIALHDQKKTAFALMTIAHRALLGELKDIGTEYAGLEKQYARNDAVVIPGTGQLPALEQLYNSCCPYLSYSSYTEHEEMTSCGACRNRLILGQIVQMETCTQEAHRSCRYFLNPRN
jgi:hypothetical protein